MLNLEPQMFKVQLSTPKRKTSNKNAFFLFGQQIAKSDIPHLIVIGSSLTYCIFREPLLITILGCVTVPVVGLWQITQAIPWLNKIGIKLNFWNLSTIIIALTLVFGLFHQSANAFFLSGLEDFVIELVNGAQTDAGSTLDGDAVSLFFNFIRAIFVIGVVIAGLFAYGQAQQGNDWRPIGTQIGLAFGVVIALDIITYIFTG